MSNSEKPVPTFAPKGSFWWLKIFGCWIILLAVANIIVIAKSRQNNFNRRYQPQLENSVAGVRLTNAPFLELEFRRANDVLLETSLDKLDDFLSSHRDSISGLKIVIIGQTMQTDATSQELALQRAQTVKDWLTAKGLGPSIKELRVQTNAKSSGVIFQY